jgi:uncharacterized protein with GYD domain
MIPHSQSVTPLNHVGKLSFIEVVMIFITLSKFRKKPTKEGIAATDKVASALAKQGIKSMGAYYTLGRYDTIFIFDSPDEGAVQRIMKSLLSLSDIVSTETLVALKREDAIKLFD